MPHGNFPPAHDKRSGGKLWLRLGVQPVLRHQHRNGTNPFVGDEVRAQVATKLEVYQGRMRYLERRMTCT